MIFSAIDSKSDFFRKFVMENYINFYAIHLRSNDEVVFRFENLIDYESIYGLKRVFLPVDLLKRMRKDIDFFISLIRDGYYLSVPIARRVIDFYQDSSNATHRMMIYGVDPDKKMFMCKDFQGHSFVPFEITYESLSKGIELYSNPNSRESDGLLAFKFDDNISHEISYSKVYLELLKLKDGLTVGNLDSYGIGALDSFLRNIESTNANNRLLARWYEVSNFLREAAKLMQLRFEILCDDLKINADESSTNIVREVSESTEKLFFLISKSFLSNRFDDTTNKQFVDLCDLSRNSFFRVSSLFMKLIIT